MQEMVDNVSYFTIRPPEKSSYRLIIYAKDLDQQVCCFILLSYKEFLFDQSWSFRENTNRLYKIAGTNLFILQCFAVVS